MTLLQRMTTETYDVGMTTAYDVLHYYSVWSSKTWQFVLKTQIQTGTSQL